MRKIIIHPTVWCDRTCPGCPIPLLDERLMDVSVVGIAHGPAVRCRIARHTQEGILLGEELVWQRGGGPCSSVPRRDQTGLGTCNSAVAHGPAIRRRDAGHGVEHVMLRSDIGRV